LEVPVMNQTLPDICLPLEKKIGAQRRRAAAIRVTVP
jgi:hypothetical protein